MLRVYDLAVNAVKNPAFVPCRHLFFGWKTESDANHVKQETYRLVISGEDGKTAWDTGVVSSAQSVHVLFDGELKSRTAYTMTVTVTDNYGESAEASVSFLTGIGEDEWEGYFIKPKKYILSWAPYLRTKFTCTEKSPVRRATLYACGLGCGEYYINGKKVSEDLIDPPFTNYEREVFYRMYDVTALIGEKNAFAALLGEGFYDQSRVWGMRGFRYGEVCLKAQLEIEYENGQKQIIATNTEDFTCKNSPISSNNLYAGETYDSRFETPDFADYDGSEEGWGEVVEDTVPKGKLKLCEMPAVRSVRTRPAVSVKQVSGRSDGAWIVDFGENVAGVAEIHIPPAPIGAQYVLRFAENVNPDGSLDFRSIGSSATQCIQQDIYITRGDPQGEVWCPRFTYHGFRYMELTGYHDLRHGYGANPDLSIAVCHVLSTDLTQTGFYHGALEDMNHLQTIMMSTFRSNYHGFPEDCPAREKCGWLGDAQVVCNTGMMNYDMEAAYTKYLNDIRTSDDVYHVWQMIAPGKRGCGEASPLWGCAQVIIPYWMYWYYGNETVVRDNWDMMEKWVLHECRDAEKNGNDFIISRGLGDWCPPVGHTSPRRIPVEQSSTLMFYEICARMQELSERLDLPCAQNYGELAFKIKESFIRHYWNGETHGYDTWGSCGAALLLGVYPDGEKDHLLSHLVRMMKEDDFAMSTGIYGNKYLIPALSENGYGDLALKMMFTREHDSFGTMMDKNATSLWERIEMEQFQPRTSGASSYNHPMHAGFAYFLYADVGGIRPLKPGFEEFEIAPAVYTDIPSAEIRHVSPYGTIAVAFTRDEAGTNYTITVPENTTCHFRADGQNTVYGSGRHTMFVHA